MRARKWVVYQTNRYGNRWNLFKENYWTGEFTPSSKPSQSNKVTEAKMFDSATEAYAEAGKHKQLNWWRVGERDLELLH